MREFKFRAWENNKMYYQVCCGGMFDGIPTAPTVWNEEKGDWVNLTGQPYTKIMQYTGLKDMNRKEIYEGDIVIYDRNVSPEVDAYRFIVEWVRGKFILIGKYDSKDDFFSESLEVIGNEFEMPDWNF